MPLREVLALSPYKPLFGNRKPGNDKTHWMVFIKDEMMMRREAAAKGGRKVE